MEFIINHKRFKKQFKGKELKKFKSNIKPFPKYSKNYFDLFTNKLSKKYEFVKTHCLCGGENDILLSLTDRHCVDFSTVVCKNCGLIRAKNYYKNEDVEDFYKNHYRTTEYSENLINFNPSDLFEKQKKTSKYKYDLINEHKIKPLSNLKIIDLGGGVGGVLDHFSDDNEKYLFDFHDPYLEYAKTKKIKSVKGGLDKIDFKPDIIILSHVMEHWSNFKYEIQKLINIQKKNETLNYIEFPGVDSIKKGRRDCDILGDIHVPHFYYFTSYVFDNIMARYGFEKLFTDTATKSIYIYTGNKNSLINYYDNVKEDLISAEKVRKYRIFKNFFKLFIPSFFLRNLKRKNKIEIKY